MISEIRRPRSKTLRASGMMPQHTTQDAPPATRTILSTQPAVPRRLFLGVDGGGSKTHAVILAADGETVMGEGTSAASNPLRVGYVAAVKAVGEAASAALRNANAAREEIAAAVFGIAGVRRADVRARLWTELKTLGIKSFRVFTDSETALYGANDGAAGIVVIAGTGSICCGINAQGRRACTGGWGPMVGDEGSGIWIAQRALRAVAQAFDERSAETSLVAAACNYFGLKDVDELATKIYSPEMTNTHIAGFARCVIEAAHAGDEVAREIVREAGREIGVLAATTIKRLKMQRETFRVAYVGGVFAAGELVMQPLREAVAHIAPYAEIAPPLYPPAIAAARMALAHAAQPVAIAV
jgi:N-acetylglucosamine kinase-like BadF-type ATPase